MDPSSALFQMRSSPTWLIYLLRYHTQKKRIVRLSFESHVDNDLMNMEYVVQKLLENVIKRSLFPRSNIAVYVQVVCNDGSISFVRRISLPSPAPALRYSELGDARVG